MVKNRFYMKNFKSTLVFLLLSFFFQNLFSQNVGISDVIITPDASSILEMRATNKGMLAPRVALTATNSASPITSPANSLLIYNTATAGTAPNNVTPGFYYWESATSRWVKLLSGEVNAWLLTGNFGTTPTNNWLGTNDAQDFVIKTNNIERSRLLSAGNFLVNTTTAPIPTNATATAAFSTQVNGNYDVGIYGYGNDQDKIPLMSEQKNANGVAMYVINSAANGANGGNAFVAYSGQTGSATLSSGLQNSNTYAPAAISGSVADAVTGGKAVIGVCNNATGVGIQGQSSGTTGYGVAGYGTGTGYQSSGIFGHNQNGPGTGVWGQTTNANGVGVVGINGANAGSGTGNGLEGETSQQKGLGALGINLNSGGTAVGGVSYYSGTPYLLASGSGGSFKAPKVGVFGWAYNYAHASMGGGFTVGNIGGDLSNYFSYVAFNYNGTNYKIYGTGTVSTIVNCPPEIRDKEKAIMFCPEAPEILFQDYGVGQLKNGKARIDLDPILSHNIFVDETHPIKVFIQLEDECNGVYVTNKSKMGFDVIELQSGKSNAKFSWSVVANRADEIDPKTKDLLSKNQNLRFPKAANVLKLQKDGEVDFDDNNEQKSLREPRLKNTSIAEPTQLK